ncbi:hypothetical protein G6O67_006421 [Ophiocordyceps sinensis]|uniref:Uncharacterized protein n=1 Tax=Ophiocordyceps sinensis TaxID=72228 RepID=A0A8H4LVM2_9HYPO|nr:hypothetical protein G6O67_006421 [Ophiocordyceps sinensis]
MSRRGRPKRDSSSTPSLSNPTEASATVTPASPVQIPKHGSRDAKRCQPTHRRRYPRQVHSTESMHPSLAALLAVTDIPRQRRRLHSPVRPLIIDDIVDDDHVSGKELSLPLGRGGPLDLLLSPPEDLGDDVVSVAESTARCVLARTTSADSIPSLGGDSFTSDTLSSLDTPGTIPSSSPRRRPSPVRRSLEPVSYPSDAADEHPLAADGVAAADLDADLGAFDADDERPADEAPKPLPAEASKPLRSVFRSNLTASLRALRSAARSFSSSNQQSDPADDLLTRSVLAIDPKVPYADERRPPVTEEMPSAELRRYLNPTTGSLIDTQPQSSRAYSASIQMQTYKVQRSRCPHPSSRSAAAPATGTGPHQSGRAGGPALVRGMRQREMRENSDFIRIAVMEMAMRRRGKLDSNKPGRARWALPPRRPPMKPYEIGPNGVPARWAPMTC